MSEPTSLAALLPPELAEVAAKYGLDEPAAAPPKRSRMYTPEEQREAAERLRSQRWETNCTRCHEGVPDDGERHGCCTCRDGRFVRRRGLAEECPDCVLGIVSTASEPRDFDRANIPSGYHGCTIGNFEGPQGALAREWVAAWPPRNPFLLFEGGRGNGKTHLSVALLRELWEQRHIWGQFVEVSSLLESLRASYNPNSETSGEQILSPLRRAPVLVLDDIGVGKVSPWVDEQLFLLVGFRYARRLPLVVSVNPEGLAAIDARIRERLEDVALSEKWLFKGKNRRIA